MTMLPLKTAISDTYPNPSNAVARAGFAQLWDAANEFQQKSEMDLASASTCDIGGQASTKLRITGTTGITSFGTNYRGPIMLRFSGAVAITHNSTTLRCPGGANYTTTANEVMMAWPIASVSGTIDGWQLASLSNFASVGGSSSQAFATGNLSVTGTLGVTGKITPSQTNGIVGTTTNNDAVAGSVGEFISSTVLAASGVSLVTATDKTVTSISLTAGDWDVTGWVGATAGTGVTAVFGCSSTTNNTTMLPTYSFRCSSFSPTAEIGFSIPTRRLSLGTTTTVYLVANCVFTGGSPKGYGNIEARRVR